MSAEDSLIHAMIQKTDRAGVFQMESRALMTMLPQRRPEWFHDLVIRIAIVRPGPIQAHPYLRRRAGEQAVEYPDEDIKLATTRTLGIPLFHEQVWSSPCLRLTSPLARPTNYAAPWAWRKRGGLEIPQRRLMSACWPRGDNQDFAEQLPSRLRALAAMAPLRAMRPSHIRSSRSRLV